MGDLRRDHRQNSFDLLRLLAALGVFWGHQFAVMQVPDPFVSVRLLAIALFTFFGISGYLNARSLLRSRDVRSFLTARALRIYPGLLACVVFMLGLGLAVTTLPAFDFLFSEKVASFVLRNATLIGGAALNLPGVFPDSPYAGAMNGSLWTLPYEVYLYLFLALLFAVGSLNLRVAAIVLAVGAAGILVCTAVAGLEFKVLPGVRLNHLANFTTAFFAGVVLALCLESRRLFACVGVGLLAGALLALLLGQITLGIAAGVGAGSVVLGRLSAPRWLVPRRDISYGIYIYAWPVQQWVASQQIGSFWLSFALALSIILALAYLSSVLIEAPALALKRRLMARRDHVAASEATVGSQA